MTRALHTAWISNVKRVIFVNRIRKIVNFELGMKKERMMFIVLSRAWESLLGIELNASDSEVGKMFLKILRLTSKY